MDALMGPPEVVTLFTLERIPRGSRVLLAGQRRACAEVLSLLRATRPDLALTGPLVLRPGEGGLSADPAALASALSSVSGAASGAGPGAAPGDVRSLALACGPGDGRDVAAFLISQGLPGVLAFRGPGWEPPAGGRARPCHLEQLHLRHDGHFSPCCVIWEPSQRVGHIADPGLDAALAAYDRACSCEHYTLAPAREPRPLELLHVEFPLACQGDCAMCFLTPRPTGQDYPYFAQLAAFIDRHRPRTLLVQGGEVLIQARTMDWLEEQKARHPDMALTIITNGCVSGRMAERAGRLFSQIYLSMVGHCPRTYRTLMDLDRERTLGFIQALRGFPGVQVIPRWLTTPLNLHETGDLLRWAVGEGLPAVMLDDACSGGYLRLDTHDAYWWRIIERSGRDLRLALEECREPLASGAARFLFTGRCARFFGLGEEWFREAGLWPGVRIFKPIFGGAENFYG